MIKEDMASRLKGALRFAESLAGHTTLKIGGPADIWFEPLDVEDLKEAVKFCSEHGIRPFVIGNGSNILARDEGFRGMMIRLSEEAFKNCLIDGNRASSGAGIQVGGLLNRLAENSLGGLEFMAGIPGTLGGALVMNAGIRTAEGDMSIGGLVQEVKAVDMKGNEKILSKDELVFGYRRSNLKGLILIEASMILTEADKDTVISNTNGYLERRKRKCDYSFPGAGCIFKNPEDGIETAGQLIDRLGFKGYEKGGVAVSSKHANFILNRSSATAEDMLKVIKTIRSRAKSSYGVDLDLEIEIV